MLWNLKAVLLDLDGTVYRGNKLIKGISHAIEILRKMGLKIFFISNSSMRSRKEQMHKLRNMGIECDINEIYNTAYATASYIKRNYPKAQAYVISEGGLQKELKNNSIKIIKGENANVVVTGLDTKLTFEKMKNAVHAIFNGAVFIASNADRIYPTEKGLLPGSGTIAAFLSYATRKKPIVIGKPKTHLINAVLKDNKLKKNEVLIVGDSCETDLRVAKRMKIRCIIVLSGLTKKTDVLNLPKKLKPDFVVGSAAELPGVL